MTTTETPVIVTAAYIDYYGFAIVEVEPYRADTDSFVVVVTRFVDYPENRGQWPIGEGYAAKKDGTVGKRKIQVGRIPKVVAQAANSLYA